MEEYRREGKIRHLGFSFHDTPDVLQKICDAHNWDFAQLQINALDWTVYRSEEQYQILAERGIPCIVMEPVRGGQLANLGDKPNTLLKTERPSSSIASWSIRFAAGLPNTLMVLSGMSTLEQVTDNIQTMQNFKPLSGREHAVLQEAIEEFQKSIAVACTACGYCMPCPAGVNIPAIFSLYNDCMLQGTLYDFKTKYATFSELEKAAHCAQCGQCEAICPQHLSISATLDNLEKDIATV